MSISEPDTGLLALASDYGIESTYHDIWGQLRTASSDAVLRALQALGAPLSDVHDVPSALRERAATRGRRTIEPVIVVWDGQPTSVELRAPGSLGGARCECHLQLESGEQRIWSFILGELTATGRLDVDGTEYLVRRFELGPSLPLGYHRLTLELAGSSSRALVICAPPRAWTHGEGQASPRRWGVFMPLHALRSNERPWGGNLGDLESLMTWTAALGGSLVGTLPLLASFLDEPFDPSPYAPASRLFWNELFLDARQIPDFARSDDAQARFGSAPPPRPISEVDRVDYRAWATHQRGVLEALASSFFSAGASDPAFEAFLAQHPRVVDYARFRAAAERQRSGWIVWPESLRDGRLDETDYDPDRERYHLFVQWRLDQQLGTLGDRARQAGAQLYLDFPLGVHPDSYDTWRERASFASGIAVGAPPDLFFTGGQNWGFPPLHPRAAREHGYGYLIEAIRNHTRHAGALRIDHVMGLLRLYWIPHGLEATEGVYVKYAAEELYAILALESQRAQCLIVGEDLGTVPDTVRGAMAEHDLQRMYVAQFEMAENPDQALNPPPETAMASLNTHDTVLFGGFWEGLDIDIMRALELIDDADREHRRADRARLMGALCEFLRRVGQAAGEDSAAMAARGALKHLAASRVQTLMVTLEDLWLERQPQNVPGTGEDWGNWRRKSRYSLDELTSSTEITDFLREIDRLRQTGIQSA